MDKHSKIFLGTITILIGTNLFIYTSYFQRRGSSNWVDHTNQVKNIINEFGYNVRKAESAQRGYLLTGGKNEFLQPYELAVTEKDRDFDLLRKLTGDNETQQKRLLILNRLQNDKFAELKRTLIYAKNNKDTESLKKAIDLVKSGYGNNLSTQIEDVLAAMRDEEDYLLEVRIRQRGDRERYELASYGISVIVSLVTLFIIFYFAKDDKYRLNNIVKNRTQEIEFHKREIEKKSEELGIALQEKTQALISAQKLNELKSRIIDIVSHEYRTPLTTILSSAELLELYGESWSADKRTKKLKTIQKATRHLNKLVSDVLISSRSSDLIDFNPLACNLNELILDIIEEIEYSYRSNGNGIKESDEENIQFISQGDIITNGLFDERLVRQMLINLLTNAIKYSPNAVRPIQVLINWNHSTVAISITDFGIGIPEQDQSRLFEAFHRASNVSGIQGIGIGLSIVKQCVERHNGSIVFSSVENEGTTFTITLPIQLS